MAKQKIEQFNMMVFGVGGQGLITLLQVVSEAARAEGYDIKTSELHGLSQRGGSVEVHIRFGRKIYSPLVSQGKADLVLGLEMQESLRGAYFANPKTKFLVNKFVIPIPLETTLSEKEISESLSKVSKDVSLIPAADICRKELGADVVSGIFLLSLAVARKMIPLKANSVLTAIKKIIPAKYLELNLKAFDLAKS
jgi:indolepyruvate ferredoxin oxidoreductase beta subunit